MATTTSMRDEVIAAFATLQDETWVVCEQQELLAKLMTIKPAVYHRSPVEAFTGVRVISDEYGVCLWATNIAVAARVDVDWLDGSPTPFDALVSYANLVRSLRTMGRGPVQIEAYPDGGHCGVRLSAAHRTLSLPALPTEDFPANGPFDPECALVTTTAGPLATVLARALPLCAKRPLGGDRSALVGVCLDLADERPSAVACESHSLCDLPVNGTIAPDATNVVLPADAVKAISGVLETAGDIAVRVSTTRRPAGYEPDQDHVIFEMHDGAHAWAVRTLRCQYPSWRQVLPEKKAIARIDFDVAELADAVQEAVKLMQPDSPARLMIERSDGTAKVLMRVYDEAGMEFEQTLVEANITAGRSKPLTIGLNAKLLLKCSQAVGTPRAVITIYGRMLPVLITGGAARCLLAPVRLADDL